jgi:hypothetical protein
VKFECRARVSDSISNGPKEVWPDVKLALHLGSRRLLDVGRKGGGAAGCEVEEEYSCGASGIVRVTIFNRSAAHGRGYTLARWTTKTRLANLRPRGSA